MGPGTDQGTGTKRMCTIADGVAPASKTEFSKFGEKRHEGIGNGVWSSEQAN